MSSDHKHNLDTVPELDPEVWRQWLEKGERRARERSAARRKLVIPGLAVLLAFLIAGYQYWLRP